MKSLLTTELAPEIFIQGLGLQRDENTGYHGRLGRHEVLLRMTGINHLEPAEEEVQIVYVGLTGIQSQVRPGDIVMAGSDELLDKAFKALDELDQRGVVISLASTGEQQIQLDKDELLAKARTWKERKLPFLCLFMVDGTDSASQARLVSLVRKILND